jgi:YD repeat-containing protein
VSACCAPDLTLCNRDILPTISPKDRCGWEKTELLKLEAEQEWEKYIENKKAIFIQNYTEHCMNELHKEELKMAYTMKQHHYTLYYYDQLGNLVQTVPPTGVQRITSQQVITVFNNRNNVNASPIHPSHTLTTGYQYNSLNQVIWQKTPDGGVSWFWYDNLKRLVLSQNAKQAVTKNGMKRWSYTLYDNLGRTTEVGELNTSNNMNLCAYDLNIGNGSTAKVCTQVGADYIADIVDDNSELNNMLYNGVLTRTQITRTFYDYQTLTVANGSFDQTFLRNRVAHTAFYPIDNGTVEGYRYATHYSYDIHGNVFSLVQENKMLQMPLQQYKQIDYQYDLVSGKVNTVTYQYKQPDQFFHRYKYDADNRIINVSTSQDSIIWSEADDHGREGYDAEYTYYYHGPLARTELGDLKVQGLDYIYTMMGWLKGVNSDMLNMNNDPGLDGVKNSYHASTAKDVMGFSLHYFEGDYLAAGRNISGYKNPQLNIAGSDLDEGAKNLYNGNIRAMVTAIEPFMTGTNNTTPLAFAYRYDQLNRLMSAQAYNNADLINNFTWKNDQLSQNNNLMQTWLNTFTYDANGNILSQKRNGNAPIGLDDLTYHYDINQNNRLQSVSDNVASSNYSDDIDDQISSNYGRNKMECIWKNYGYN